MNDYISRESAIEAASIWNGDEATQEWIKHNLKKLPAADICSPQWISVEYALPPPAKCEQYLVYVRSGGGVYGDYEYNIDFAWWGMCYDLNNRECVCDWETILNDWDGDVQITHWMPLPDPPEDLGNA